MILNLCVLASISKKYPYLAACIQKLLKDGVFNYLHMRLFGRKKKEEHKTEEPKKEVEKHPRTRGKCPICGSACDVVDYGIFLGYFCMKCGPTQEIKVG